MISTFFRPSIHGWPFGNSWKKDILFDKVTLSMGFCGGMCWRALQRFYNAIPIPRVIPQPSEGDELYGEIWDAQVNSVTASTLWKIYEWQMSPDLSHRTNLMHSLGYRTKKAWPAVRSKIDASKPVTLTLITSSNDSNLLHLKDVHRVVAYAYKIRSINPGEGSPDGADKAVIIHIYDPNYPNDDNVRLRFFLGGEDNNIRINHNRGDDVHGFFLDDKSRNFKYRKDTQLDIIECKQTKIISADRAVYNFIFSWKCRIIPYFKIQIDEMEALQSIWSCLGTYLLLRFNY